MYDYRGAIHVHSTFSDGHEEVAAILAAANEAALDFVVLTDHDAFPARQQGLERWHDSVLLIAGVEVTPSENHYIAFGEGEPPDIGAWKALTPQELIDRVREAGWLGFVTHPDRSGSARFGVPACPWTAWETDGFTGIGIWDLMTDLVGLLEEQGPEAYDDFARRLRGPKPEALARFDALAARRRTVAIGELDNHAWPVEHEGRRLVVLPHAWAFRTVTNHVLLEEPLARDPGQARRQILEAIGAGRLYVSLDWDADPSEFSFEVEEGDRSATMGQSLELEESARVVVMLPEAATIRVVQNGGVVHEEAGADEAIVELEQPGPVRVEVRRRGLPWIFSNPVYVER